MPEATSAVSAAEGPATPRPPARQRRMPGRARSPDRNERRAGVGHERHGLPLPHCRDELGGALPLVVLVIRDELRAHVVAVEQLACAPRVLARHEVGRSATPRARAESRPRGCRSASGRRRDDLSRLGHRSSSAISAAPSMPASSPKCAGRPRGRPGSARARAAETPRAPGSSSSSPAADGATADHDHLGANAFASPASPTPSLPPASSRTARRRDRPPQRIRSRARP